MCSPSEWKKCPLHILVLSRLPWGSLLSFIGSLSPPGMVSLGSFSEQVLQDESLYPLILHRWCPSQTGASASFVEWQVTWHACIHRSYYVSLSWMSHGVFLGRVLPFHVITGATTQSMSVSYKHSWVVGQLPKSQLGTSSISAKECGFAVDIWSQTLGS